MRPSICARFQNTQNLEIKPPLKLQRQLKNASFPKILTTVVNVPSMEKFSITVIGKTILRSAVHVIEKLSTKMNKLKLNHLLLTNTNFSLIRSIFKKPRKIWLTFLKSKMNLPIGAQCNVIPVEYLENISPKLDLQPVNVKLSAYNGLKIPVVGKCSLTLDHKNNSFKVSFIVVDWNSVPILELKKANICNLWK